MAHAHDHDDTAAADSVAETGRSPRRLALVAGINFVGFVAELAGGILFGSVALISDAFHMLFDMLAYAMAFGASYTADRFESGGRWSYGLHRLEPVAAFLNGILLVPMVGYIVWESYQRFLEPVTVEPAQTLVIATGGLLVNIGSVYVVQGDEMSLNERGAFYHLLGDAGGSVAVIVATVAVAVFDVPIVDPAAAILIAVLILVSSGKLLRESSSILFQRSPVDVDDVKATIEGVDGVERVEDIHIWQVCSQLTVGTVRIADTATTLAAQQEIRSKVHDRLAEYGVDHATIECVGTDEDTDGRTEHSH